ncbi:MAG: hypothetical protein ACRCYE_15210 [Sarcina sp.]
MWGIKFRLKVFFRNTKVIGVNILFLICLIFSILDGKEMQFSSGVYFNTIFSFTNYYLFLMIINGYLIGSIESNNKCSDVFKSIHKAEKKIVKEKVFVGFILAISSWILIVCFLTVGILRSNINLNEVGSLYLTTINMSLLPLIIGVSIGIFIGDNIKKEKAYIILTAIWIFIIPLNGIVYNVLNNYFDINFIRWNLTLGSLYQEAFDGILGPYIHSYEYMKCLIFILILLVIYTIRYNRKKYIIYAFSFVLGIVGFSNVYANKLNIEDDMNIFRTSDFYAHDSKLNFREKKIFNNYKIENYKIEIIPGNKSSFDVSVNIKVGEDTNNLSFMLFNGFEISKIRTSNGNAGFERDEDFVNVQLPQPVGKDKNITLEFIYSGYSSKEFFIREHGMNLNSRFPFIPSNVIKPVMDINGFYSYFDLSVKSDYEVIIKDNNNKYHSNLAEVAKNHFKGTADGLNLISGNNIFMEHKEDTEYYFSKLNQGQNNSALEDMKNKIEGAISKVNEVLGEETYVELEKFFVIYSRDLNFIDIINDTVIIYTPVITSGLTENDYVEMILNEYLKTDETTETGKIIKFVFMELAMDYYNGIETENILNKTIHENDEELSIHNSLINAIKSSNEKEKEKLFREFYDLCKSEIKFADLKILAEKYREKVE